MSARKTVQIARAICLQHDWGPRQRSEDDERDQSCCAALQVVMRDSWLVEPPPHHFERQLTNKLVDSGEAWVQDAYAVRVL